MRAVHTLFELLAPGYSARRALREGDRTPVSEVEERRLAKVVGAVAAGGPATVAPLSGVECLAYAVRVDVAMAGQGVGWVPYTHTEGELFAVADDTGEARVDPQGARVALPFHFDTLSQPKLTEEQLRVAVGFLVRCGHAFKRWVDPRTLEYHDGRRPRTLRVREGIVLAGDEVAVAGYAVREPVRDAARADSYRVTPTAMTFRAGRRTPLWIASGHGVDQDE